MSWRVDGMYNINDNSINNDQLENTEYSARTTAVLREIGVRAHTKGFKYLRTAILLTLDDPGIICAVTKELYPAVAEQYGTTACSVERAMRSAIEHAWSKGDIAALGKYFAYDMTSLQPRPTNSFFIATIAEYIKYC